MQKIKIIFLAGLLVAAATQGPAAMATDDAQLPLPQPVRDMLTAAVKSGNDGRIDAVAAVARETNPHSVSEINRIVNRYKGETELRRRMELGRKNVFANWSGSGEVGGSMATGNADTVTLAIGLNLRRTGLSWRHRFGALADLQRSNGETSQERYGINYQADWNASERVYLLGRLGWERNVVSGLRSRFTESLGVGYKILDNYPVRWSVEGGPALTQAYYYDDNSESHVAGRAASSLIWNWSAETQLTQESSILVQSDNSAILATTALSTKLIGALSARASVSIAHETNPPLGRVSTDTVTRATLVYDF